MNIHVTFLFFFLFFFLFSILSKLQIHSFGNCMTYYKAMLPDMQESMGLFLESLEDIVAIVNLHALLVHPGEWQCGARYIFLHISKPDNRSFFLKFLYTEISIIARPSESRPTEKLKVDFRSVPYNSREIDFEAVCPQTVSEKCAYLINCLAYLNKLLVLRAGCGIWLYQFLTIAYLFILHTHLYW